ncbi:uncharacterized protein LOC126556655 [Anopheles maculipalpis]|uniref:uncharacterized protein LOC126556655 n=1 Tax=Anopheles maculipalpis TaxID=1496333 RepID=UPI0021597039|nr:uncharacterized protein LOC126556655 [Anopheles maculipalpis]
MNSHRPLSHGHHHGAPLQSTAMIERSGGVSVVVNPRFEADKQAWEDAIRGYNGNDPLDLWFNYITWYEQNRSFDRTNNLRSIVEKCLLLYQDTEGYKQDTRMVKIWMKYTNMQQSPASFYQMMYKKNIGTQCASFYIGWAESAYKQAESIYNLGIQMKAQPIEELHEAQRNYRLYNESLAKKRSASTMVEQRQPIPSQSPPQKRLKQELGNYQLQTGTNGAVIHHDVPNGTFVNQQQQQQHPSHAYYHQQKASGSYYLPENAANGGTYYTSNGQKEPYQSTNSFASTESGPSTVPVTSSASASAFASSSHAQQSGQHQALSGEVNYHAAASNGDSLQQQELPHRTEAEPRETEYQPTDESIIECNLNNSAYVISSSLSYVYDDSDLVQYPVAEEIPRPAPEDATESVPDRPTSQEPTYESDAIRLPPNFAREAKSNHETWDVPLCLEEPYDPNRQCCYPKHLVYPDLHAERPTMEFSLEEIRAQRWLERKRQHEKQKKMQEEEEEAQRQAKAAQLEKEKQMRQMQQMKYQQQQQQQQQRMYNAQQYSTNASGHMPIGQTMQTQPNNSYHSQPQQMRQGSIQHTSNFYHQQQQQPYHGYSNGCYTASSPQMQQSHHSYQPANVPAATVIQNHHHHHQHQQQHLLHHQQQQTHHHHHQQQHHSPVPTSHMHSPNTVATPYGQHGHQQHHYAPVNHHHGNLHSPQPYHIPYENYNQHNSYPAGHQPGQQPQHQQQQEVTTPQRTYQSMTNVVSPYGYGSPVQQEAIAPRPGNAHYAMAPQTPPNHQIYPQSPGHQHTHHGHHHQQQHPQLGMVGVSPQSQSNRGHSVLQQSPHQEHPYNHHQQQQHPHHSHHHSQYTTAHYNTNEQQDTKLHTGYAQNCTPDSAKLNPSQHNYKEHGGPAAMTEPSETQPPVNGGTASGSYINNAQERQDRGVEHQVQQNNNHGKYNNANNNCDDFEEQIEASTIRFSTPTENGISRKQTITIKFKKEKTGLSLAVDSPSSPAATGTVGESSGSATTALLDQHNEQQQVPASASSAVPVEEKSKKHKKHTQQQRMSETGMGKSSSSAKGKHSRKKQASLSQAPDEHHMDDANLLLSFSRPEKDEDSCLSVQSQTDASSVGSKKKKKSKRSKSGTSSKEKRRRHRYDLDEDYRVEDEEEADEDQGGDGRAQNGVMRRERVLDDEYSEATVGGYEEDDDGVEDQYYEVEEEEDEQVNGEVEENDEEEEEEEDDDEEEYYEEEETSRETTQRRRTIGGDRRAATKRIIRPDEDDSSYQSNSEFNTSFSNISFAGDNSNGPFNFGGSNCSTPARRTQTSGGVGGGGAFSKTSTPVGSFRYLRKQETNLSTLGQNDDSMNSTVVESSFFQAGEHDEEGRRRRLEKALGTIETHLGRPFVDPFNSELCRAFLTKVDFPSRNRDPADNYHLSNANLPKLLKGQTVNLGGTGYSIEKEVGRGSYGSVFRANNTQTSAVVAIKYQKPANTWELYICTEVKKRLTNLKMLPGFMDISAAVIAPNASVLVSEFSQYGSLLDINNKIRTAATRKVMHESLVMHFSCQILSIVEHLHACNIIHADIKPDNFLLMKIPSRDLEEPTLRLIDFGCAIDMNFFEPKRQFKKVIQTDGFTCIEMQEGRPWSYQTDLFCVAGTIHVMLFGEYMQLVKKYESGWDIKQKLPRYLKKHVWTEVFQKLLNIKDIDHMPSLPDLRRLIYEEAYKMDSELTTHIRSLSNLLKSR